MADDTFPVDDFAAATSTDPAARVRRPRISLGSEDLPGQAADWIVDRIGAVRSATTENGIVAVRALVFGLVVAVLGTAAVVLLVITLVRITDAYLPIGSGVGDAVWAAYLFLGTLFTVLGLGAWASRRGSGTPTPLVVAGVIDIVIIVVVVMIGIMSGLA